MIAVIEENTGLREPAFAEPEPLNHSLRGLVTLWSIVKQIAAHNLVQMGRNVQAMSTAVARTDPHTTLNQADADLLLAQLVQIRRDCEMMGFVVTRDLVNWAIGDYSENEHTHSQVRSSIETIMTVYQQELSRECFLHVQSKKASYMRSVEESIANPAYGLRTLAAFQSSVRDMSLAGNCYACGLNDACVFHLMRVLERGLGVLAAKFSVAFKHENWHNIIEQVESRIRKIDGTAGTDWKEQQRVYAEVACEFMFFKDAWRNHAIHGRADYDDEQAKNIFDHTCVFMKRLAEIGLAESL